MCARAMLNCGLDRLRLVRPRDGWPNPAAKATAADADAVLDRVEVFATLDEALADCHHVLATTARARSLAVPVETAETAARQVVRWNAGGAGVRGAVRGGGLGTRHLVGGAGRAPRALRHESGVSLAQSRPERPFVRMGMGGGRPSPRSHRMSTGCLRRGANSAVSRTARFRPGGPRGSSSLRNYGRRRKAILHSLFTPDGSHGARTGPAPRDAHRPASGTTGGGRHHFRGSRSGFVTLLATQAEGTLGFASKAGGRDGLAAGFAQSVKSSSDAVEGMRNFSARRCSLTATAASTSRVSRSAARSGPVKITGGASLFELILVERLAASRPAIAPRGCGDNGRALRDSSGEEAEEEEDDNDESRVSHP